MKRFLAGSLFVFLCILSANELKNGNFAAIRDGLPENWTPVSNSPVAVSAVSGGGNVIAGESGKTGGLVLKQSVEYEKPDPADIRFSGWSKAENVSGGDYALSLTVFYDDGTKTYLGKSWKKGTHDWEQISAKFTPAKPVKQIVFHIVLRGGSGKASFQDVTMTRGKPLPKATARVLPEQEGKNHLLNPALKFAPDGKTLPGWDSYNPDNPISAVTDESNTLRVGGSCDEKKQFGLKQTVEYAEPSLKPINFSGWSKAQDVGRGTQYCLYLDICHSDGSWTYSVKTNWKTGTHDWESAEYSFRPKKPVSKISFFILLRKGSGTALFRDIKLTRGEPELQIHYTAVHSLAPWKNDHYRIRYGFLKDSVKSEYKLLDPAGKVLKSGSASAKDVDATVQCPGNPVKLVMSASDGSSNRETSVPVIRIEPPAELAGGKKYQVWTADSMTKVSPLTFPDRRAEKTVRISLAGGERESVQILISNVSGGTLKNLTMEIKPLGKSFPGKLSWERVAYVPRAVNCNTHKESLPEGIYWLPDPLLPAAPFDVPQESTQALWLTAHADGNAPEGTWKAVVSVKGLPERCEIPCEIQTFGFRLPNRFSYRSAFAVMDGYLAMQYPDMKIGAIRRKAWDVMLDHRLNPDDITRTELPEIEDLLYARSRGMNYFTICNLVPKPKEKKLWTLAAPVDAFNDSLLEEFERRFDPYVAELKKHGLEKDGAFYGFDERGKEYFPAMEKVRNFLKKKYGIPMFSTSAMYRILRSEPARTDCYASDWYCPPTMFYEKDFSESLRKKGHQVWWYTCCGPYFPYANFSSLEYPFRDGRLLAWMTFFNCADGFLFWHTNNWFRGTKFLNETSSFQPDFRLFVIGGSAGDGQLLYPGKNTVFPSIRLANVRDGSEDYDYLKLLETSKGRTVAMKAAETIVPDVCKYETDHRKILENREHVAKLITEK